MILADCNKSIRLILIVRDDNTGLCHWGPRRDVKAPFIGIELAADWRAASLLIMNGL